MPPQQQGQFMNHDERGPRSSREARQAARAAKNGNSHYRRAHSPDQDDFAFSGGEEPRSPASDVALQDAILAQAQAHQQRVVPVGQQGGRGGPPQRKPPGGPPNGNGQGPPLNKQPPSYPGPPLDDGPQNNGQNNGQPRQGHYRRNTGQPVRRPSGSEGPSNTAVSPQRSGAAPNDRRAQLMAESQQRGPPSPGGLSASGNSINRLNSPSVMKSVLQPLEQKMHEYDNLMQEAQQQMLQLDEELRIMQDRRMQAEERYLEAKSKHDEYERQHEGVGRALRGEPERLMSPEPLHRVEILDHSYDDRPVSNQSSQKMKGRSRLRLSLFKGN